MQHIHTKIHHHLTKHRTKILTSLSVICAIIIISGAFFITRGSNPSLSELAFTEKSSSGIGSVIPASCESGYPHGYQLCPDGSQITDCDTCPAPAPIPPATIDPTPSPTPDPTPAPAPSCDPTSSITYSNFGCTWEETYCADGSFVGTTLVGCTSSEPAPAPTTPTCTDPNADNYMAEADCTYSSSPSPSPTPDPTPSPTPDPTPSPTPTTYGPDLTFAVTSPTSARATKSVTYTATVSNIGDEATGRRFNNLLQIATGINGTGTVTDVATNDTAALNPSRTRDISFDYTFASTGTYSMRMCADKNSAGDSGRVTETNASGTAENNNCGSWTTVTVTNGECALPWGGTIANNASVTAYQYATVATTDSCANYDESRKCKDSVLSGSFTNQSCIQADPSVSSFNVTPRTLESGGLVKLTWSILNPIASCKIQAAVQIPTTCDATCRTKRATASTTINALLTSGTTNANDPNGGSRNMTTAITTAVSGGSAKGEKSLNLDYSTTFTVSCGTSITPVKSIIYVTEKVEG